MTISIVLEEEDLATMPTDMRDGLLRWYFDVHRRPPIGRPTVTRVAPAVTAENDESRRITFAKLVAAGLLKPSQEIFCRTLKRQQQKGQSKYLGGARVTKNGAVEFNGSQYAHPSNLAVEMVRQNDGGPTSLNGFDYLFVKSTNAYVPLKKLRDQFLRSDLRSLAADRVEDAWKVYGRKTTIEDHIPQLKKKRGE
jgi:hypothetical protein